MGSISPTRGQRCRAPPLPQTASCVHLTRRRRRHASPCPRSLPSPLTRGSCAESVTTPATRAPVCSAPMSGVLRAHAAPPQPQPQRSTTTAARGAVALCPTDSPSRRRVRRRARPLRSCDACTGQRGYASDGRVAPATPLHRSRRTSADGRRQLSSSLTLTRRPLCATAPASRPLATTWSRVAAPPPQLHVHVRLTYLCVHGCLTASSDTWTHSGLWRRCTNTHTLATHTRPAGQRGQAAHEQRTTVTQPCWSPTLLFAAAQRLRRSPKSGANLASQSHALPVPTGTTNRRRHRSSTLTHRTKAR
jgi:hypothetical protein